MIQPEFAPFQIAYVVRSLEEAVARWVAATGAGPFFLTDHRLIEDPRYRGTPSRAEYRIAMGFCGAMQIELIEQTNDAPSIYRELIDRQGEGYHHFMPVISDFDEIVARYLKAGCQPAFTGHVKGIGRLLYVDGSSLFGGFVEFVDGGEVARRANDFMEASARGWDGKDPLRSFPVA